MRRRLDLAMTLAGDPRIIFLDEPTTVPLAAAMAAWAAKRDREHGEPAPADTIAASAAVTLLSSHIATASPAWQKLNKLSREYHSAPGEAEPS